MNNTNLIVNRLIENDAENFEILSCYSKHNVGKVTKIYNDSIIPKIFNDFLCSRFTEHYSQNFKSEILSQIIKNSSVISIKQLSNIVYEDEKNVEKIVINLIRRGLPYRIDKVKNQIVQLSENKGESDLQELYEKIKSKNEDLLWNKVYFGLR